MKTFVSILVAAFVCVATASYSQDQKSLFQSATLAKAADGASVVQLDWKRGPENAAYYLVERSTNGKDFKQVALVFTAEDDSFTNYKFKDKSFAGAGTAVYYRIAIVDKQKEVTYLPMRKINFSTGETSTASPVFANAVAISQ